MTKSSRRMDIIAGRSKWSTSDKKCEQCNGAMVKLRANIYVCTKCGLEQCTNVKGKTYIHYRPYSTPLYLQHIEKQWEGKDAFYRKELYERPKTKNIDRNKSKNIKAGPSEFNFRQRKNYQR